MSGVAWAVLGCASGWIFGPAPALAATLPGGGAFTAGTGHISGTSDSLTIDQTTGRAIIDWQHFSIGQGGSVTFNNGGGATLNRVTGGALSSILGTLKASGTLYLINPAGVVIGPGGTVATGGGFTASTLDLADQNFMSGGALLFQGGGLAEVRNLGSISTTGGDVFLIGRSVTNDGTITAPGGTVGLGAGAQVLLKDSDSAQRVFVQLDGGDVTNSGTITAVQAELKAAGGNVYALAGNAGGLIRATGIATKGGHVWLSATDGGAVTIAGTVDASGPNGGAIAVDGAAATVTADAHLAADGTAGTGGSISVLSDGTTAVHGRLTATGALGDGGSIETSGHSVDFSGITVDASSRQGSAGTWLIDPQDLLIDVTGALAISASLDLGTSVVATTSSCSVLLGVCTGTNGDITVASSIAKTLGGDASLTLMATRNITVNSGVTITSTSGRLAVTLQSNTQDTVGAIFMNTGSAIQSNGGAITLGGGSNIATSYAVGDGVGGREDGITLDHATLSSAGGNIILRGKGGNQQGTSVFGFNTAIGIIIGMSTIDSGTGTISITAASQPHGGGLTTASIGHAMELGQGGATTITSAAATANAITISGDASASDAADASGVQIFNNTSILATGIGGGITISGAGGATAAGRGIYVNPGDILAVSGPISLTGRGGTATAAGISIAAGGFVGYNPSNVVTTSNSPIVMSADRMTLAGTIQSSGALTILPLATTDTIDLGATGGGGAAQYDAAWFAGGAVFTQGFSSITIGAAADSALLNVNAALSVGDNLQLIAGGGDMTLDGTITLAATKALTLSSTGAVSQTAVISADNVALLGSGGSFVLNASNLIKIVAANTGSLSLSDTAGTLTIGTVGAAVGATLTGNLVLTDGNAVTQTQILSAGGLALLGTGGGYVLTNAGNVFGTLAGDTGSADLADSVSVAIGTVGATTGLAATGPIKLTSPGNVSIASGAVVSSNAAGNAILLAAGGNFTNSAGAGAITLGTAGARWLIYSTSPAGTTTGGLAGPPLYAQPFDFTTRTGAAFANLGNRFLYSISPVLTVRPSDTSTTYDGNVPVVGYAVSGLVGGDDASLAVSGAPVITGAGSNAGSYTLSAAIGTLTSDFGYRFTFSTGTLAIAKRVVTYSIANAASTYGAMATPGAVTLSPLVTGDDLTAGVTVVDGSGNPVTLAPGTAAGSYTEEVTALSGTSLGNYSLAIAGNTNGGLTISPAMLQVVASAETKVYGSADPTLATTVTGLVAGDTLAVLHGTPTRTPGETVPGGPYAITQGSLTAGSNYTVLFTGNALTITKAPLTLTVANASRFATQPNPAFSVSYATFLNGDTSAVVTGVTLATAATQASPAGTFAITATGATADNYDIAVVPGVLTVNPSPDSTPPASTLFVPSPSEAVALNAAATEALAADHVRRGIPQPLPACKAKPGMAVVIPEPDGHVGTIVVHADNNATVLHKPFLTMLPSPCGSKARPLDVEPEEILALFHTVLAAKPAPPVLFTLYYGLGQTRLPADSQALVARVLAEVRARADAEITVTGFTDTMGKPSRNQALALKRAKAVRDVLVAQGISPDSITVVPRGELGLEIPTASQVNEPRNRRVIVDVR